jgi:PAS domain S-box-containing protein
MKQPDENQTQIILDSIADGVFTVDLNWKIASFNRAAEKITGIKKDEAIGLHCWEVFRANICEKECSLRQTIKTGSPIVSLSIIIMNNKDKHIPVSISTAVLKDNEGNIVGGVETFRDLSVIEELRKELSEGHSFLNIISKNNEMKRLFGKLELISKSNTTILLEGESGTGKELFAKAIHSLGHRKSGPFITIDCGSLPDTLLESELFGYRAGAFTDAKKDKPGRITLAEGGTLFLDEIGDISQMLQARLLRLLQDKLYEPLGSTGVERADVRIVAATNKNLQQLVNQGDFRQDLYYRINVVKLFLPPLRDRKEDIPLLIEHFIQKFSCLNGKEIRGVSPDVHRALMSYDFPGNVRELENVIEYAFVMCEGFIIGIEHLPKHLHDDFDTSEVTLNGKPSENRLLLNNLEKKMIFETLRKNNYNRTITAKQMGIHPTTLWRKIKRLKIEIPEQDGRSNPR